jgi:TonB family protein
MKSKMSYSLFLVVCIIWPWTIAALAAEGPVFEKLTIPSYPFLARLTGAEGSVHVNLTLDPHCNIGDIVIADGPTRLMDAVTRAIHSGGLHLAFRGCSSVHAENIHLSFIFSLRGQPTNEWSPTYIDVHSGHELSYEIEITTTPPDLRALGLEKSAHRSSERSYSEHWHLHNVTAGVNPIGLKVDRSDVRMPLLTDFALPGYPVLARIGRVQGEVRVELQLDQECRVSASDVLEGHPLLNSAVREAVREWRFASCAAAGGRVEARFHFELAEPEDPSSDDWSPTHTEMTDPYEFQIKAVAPDPIIYN